MVRVVRVVDRTAAETLQEAAITRLFSSSGQRGSEETGEALDRRPATTARGCRKLKRKKKCDIRYAHLMVLWSIHVAGCYHRPSEEAHRPLGRLPVVHVCLSRDVLRSEVVRASKGRRKSRKDAAVPAPPIAA